MEIRAGVGDHLQLSSGATANQGIRIRNDGNVGIGTTTPTEKLVVVGNVNVTGTLYIAGDAIGVWKTWTPTFTGFSADPTNVKARYIRIGDTVTVVIGMSAGTSDATTFTMTAPFSASADIPTTVAPAQVQDNGPILNDWGRIFISAGNSGFTFGVNPGVTGGFTASGTKGVAITFIYEAG